MQRDGRDGKLYKRPSHCDVIQRLTNYIVGERWNIIFRYRVAKRLPDPMDGLPGVITSDDDFAINSAGSAITETTITGFTLVRSGGFAFALSGAQSSSVQ